MFAGDGERVGRPGGEHLDGRLQTPCWSGVPGHFPVHRFRKNREEGFESDGEEAGCGIG